MDKPGLRSRDVSGSSGNEDGYADGLELDTSGSNEVANRALLVAERRVAALDLDEHDPAKVLLIHHQGDGHAFAESRV